ncbi:MAG: F0F1 ATP synthase subunit B [bacterium]|nr:F0F1 ATP synthase subunit B [bacterium]
MDLITNVQPIIAAAEAESEGIAALGLDPLAILAQTVTFVVLFWIIKKYALDGIVKTLEKRRKTIEDGVRLGREMEAEKEQLDERVEKALLQARNEADKIIAEGHQEATAIIKKAENDASRKVDAMLAEAKANIDENIEKARKSLESDIRVLIARATEVILEEKVDAKKDSGLIDRAINRVRAL